MRQHMTTSHEDKRSKQQSLWQHESGEVPQPSLPYAALWLRHTQTHTHKAAGWFRLYTHTASDSEIVELVQNAN